MNIRSKFVEFKLVKVFLNKRSILIIASIAAILYPLLLVLDINAHFNVDWYHNLWLIGYFGEYFFRHQAFPIVINTFSFTNINTPFFYGYMFYPALGLMSSILGPNITLRLAIVLAYSVQFLATLALIKKLTNNVWVGVGIACLSIWTIYPLTNLYNRSAILEFFAVSFLFTSICIWFISTICEDIREKLLLRVLFALFFSFSAGTHPITALYGGIYVGVLTLMSIVSNIKKRFFWSELFSVFMVFILVLLILLPWFYVILKFGDQLRISNFFDQRLFIFKGIDELWVRLSPFPLDLRSIKAGIMDLKVPYLDAQMNIPLLLYLLFQVTILFHFAQGFRLFRNVVKNEKYILTLMLFSLFSFLYFFVVSISPSMAAISHWFLWRAQFVYRFVTYQNLSIFLGVIAVFMLIQEIDIQISFQPIMKYLLVGCLVLSAQSVLIKLVHADSVEGVFLGKNFEGEMFLKGYGRNRQDKDSLITLPYTFTSILDYSTGSVGMGQNPDTSIRRIDINITVLTKNNFGELGQVDLRIAEPSMVGVNIMPFPWNYVSINGKMIDRKDTFLIGDRTYFQLEPGDYKITSEVKLDFPWKISRFVSFSTIISCSMYLIFNIRKVKNAML